jgi:hypothetical protein
MYKLDNVFNCDLDTQNVTFVFLLFVLRHPLTSHRPAEFHSARVIQVVDLHQKSFILAGSSLLSYIHSDALDAIAAKSSIVYVKSS